MFFFPHCDYSKDNNKRKAASLFGIWKEKRFDLINFLQDNESKSSTDAKSNIANYRVFEADISTVNELNPGLKHQFSETTEF